MMLLLMILKENIIVITMKMSVKCPGGSFQAQNQNINTLFAGNHIGLLLILTLRIWRHTNRILQEFH